MNVSASDNVTLAEVVFTLGPPEPIYECACRNIDGTTCVEVAAYWVRLMGETWHPACTTHFLSFYQSYWAGKEYKAI